MAEVLLEEPYIVFVPQIVQWIAYPRVALLVYLHVQILVLVLVVCSVSWVGWEVLGVGEVRNRGGDSLEVRSVGGRGRNIVRRAGVVVVFGGGSGGGSGLLTSSRGRGWLGCGGGLDPFDQTGYPNVTHGVLELFAVDVTLELLGLLLDSGSPIVLYLIVCPTRQILGYLGPPS